MRNQYPFQSAEDRRYYFWLGDRLQGPYDEYIDAHAELTKALEEGHGKEESGEEESK